MEYVQANRQYAGQTLAIQAAPEPKRADAVSATVSRLYDHADVLSELCNRADAIASGIDNPEPQDASTSKENPRPPSLVGSLQFLDMRINSLTNELRRHLNRIESALG